MNCMVGHQNNVENMSFSIFNIEILHVLHALTLAEVDCHSVLV